MSTQVDSIATLVADVEYFIQVCGQILISDEVPGEHFIHMQGLISLVWCAYVENIPQFHRLSEPAWQYSISWGAYVEIIY